MAKLNYSVVIFNLDNTLVKTQPAAKEAYRQAIYFTAKQLGLHDKRDKLYNHWKRIVTTLLGEKKPVMRRFAYSLKLLFQEHNIPEAYFSPALHTYERVLLENLEPAPGAKDLFKSLADHKLKIAVITGSDKAEAKKKLKATGLYSHIDCLVTSSDVDTMKPNPLFITTVCKELESKPQDCVVVSDNRADDLEVAKALGCRAILIKPPLVLNNLKTKLLA